MDDWVERLRVGILAYALYTLPVGSPNSTDAERFDHGRELLVQYLVERPDATQFLFSLPVHVVAVLATTLEQRTKLGRRFDNVLATLRTVQESLHSEEGVAVLGRSQVWAFQALIGQCDPRRLLSLGAMLFRGNWRKLQKSEEVENGLADPLQVLRDPWSSTVDRCHAISEIANLLGDARSWAQIENTIYHYQFSWPLLVQSNASGADLAISLPVGVDIVLPSSFASPNLRNRKGYLTVQPEKSHFLQSGWSQHLIKALSSAKGLWRAKHGNYGEFRAKISNAGAIFDFETAERVSKPLQEIGFKGVALDGGSAEAYFAQIILSRLLGRSAIFASAVTGIIGPKAALDGSGHNRNLISPYGIKEKLAFVFDSPGLFERVVLPKDSDPSLSESLREKQSAEIHYARDLYALADCVQINGWRQQNYIRCPDLFWGIGTRQPGILPLSDPQVRNILKALQSNSASPVLTIESASGITVASALWYLENRIRQTIEPAVPPSLSWAMVRAVEWEKGLRFWRMLWTLTGASAAEFAEFADATSTEQAVVLLANALNCFEPNEKNPSHRSPDITVILDYEKIEEIEPRASSTSARPFIAQKVLKFLSATNLLKPSFDQRLNQLIGKTRILLVRTEARAPRQNLPEISKLDSRRRRALEALSVFSWGFTQQTAELVLKELGTLDGRETREKILVPLTRQGYLRSINGFYHIPSEVCEDMTSESIEQLALRHYKAGCALAPYAAGFEFPSLALDSAFRPENVHEAAYHLSTANGFAREIGQTALAGDASGALRALTRFMEPASWSLVKRLTSGPGVSSDAYEMAIDLVEKSRLRGTYIHPEQWLLAAEAAVRRAKEHTRLSLRSEVVEAAKSCFLQAIEALKSSHSMEIRNKILAAYAVFLWEESWENADAERISRDVLQMLEVEPSSASDAIDAKWFEAIADHEKDHSKALKLYLLGLNYHSNWIQLVVKGLGAASLSNANDLASVSAQLESYVDTMKNKGNWIPAAKRCREVEERRFKTLPVRVKQRWNAGWQSIQSERQRNDPDTGTIQSHR